MRTIPDLFARFVERKRVELSETTVQRSQLEDQAMRTMATRRAFRLALQNRVPAIIAEIKKASPSKGLIAGSIDPASIAQAYERGGAACLSVLTDSHFFHGSLSDLRAARSAVSIPALRKDTTIDEYQVVEAAAWGADAILLNASILDQDSIRRFRELALQYGVASLVEAHDGEELQVALAAGSDIVGINNRNPRTSQTTLETSLRLADMIPDDAVKVSLSGIRSHGDVMRLMNAGFTAFLVGEHLMTSEKPSDAVRLLIEGDSSSLDPDLSEQHHAQ